MENGFSLLLDLRLNSTVNGGGLHGATMWHLQHVVKRQFFCVILVTQRFCDGGREAEVILRGG